MSEIDKGSVQSNTTFLDRLGRGLYAEYLSTSSKVLLLAHQTDIVVRADDMGRNAIIFFLYNEINGAIHFTFMPDMPTPTKYPVLVNDIICNNYVDFLNVTEETFQ